MSGQIPIAAPGGLTRRAFKSQDIGLPEDWDPRDVLHYSSLLSEKEIKAVLRLEHRADDPQALLVAKKLRELAFESADQFDFPEYAALVNPIANNAYAMRLKNHEVHAQRSIIMAPTVAKVIMDLTTTSQICDAQLLVRPYIKILGEPSARVVQNIESSTLILHVDGERVLHSAARGFMAGKSCHYKLDISGKSSLFSGCALDKAGQAYSDMNYGIMAPTGTRITCDILLPEVTVDVEVELGIVAASYTMKN